MTRMPTPGFIGHLLQISVKDYKLSKQGEDRARAEPGQRMMTRKTGRQQGRL